MLFLLGLVPGARGFSVETMTVNGRSNPLGIAGDGISFGWSFVSESRGARQVAYQIRLGSGPGLQDVWDSGRVESDRQVDVVLPPTVTVAPGTRYHWQVRVWNQDGQGSDWSATAWFETGLLSAEDWDGADWLYRRIDSPKADSWSNYVVTVVFTLNSEAFGVFLRSTADAQNAYMFQVNVTGSGPVLKPHKRTNGGYTVLAATDLAQFGFSNSMLTGTTNILRFDVSGSTIMTALNGVAVDSRSGIAYPRGLVGFRTHGAEAGSVHRVEVVDKTSNDTLVNPDFSQGENGFSGGIVSNGALLISGTLDSVFANLPASLPLFRGRFIVRDGFTAARVYSSAQGIYEFWINGEKGGDQSLAPGWTDYETRIQSQTYDVTGLVTTGENVLGAALADGWFRGKVGLGWTRVYGDELSFIARIRVAYADGSVEWFSTGPDWKVDDGPYVRGDLQDGESYDAHREQPGWSTAGFDDSAWSDAAVAPDVSTRLVPQPDEPVRRVGMLTAASRTEILPRTWIYDLKQNMVGVPRVTLTGKKGETVTIRHGEEVYRTGPKTGQLYTDNLRTARATDTYTFASDGAVTYQPRFTQHGFRYIEITGTTNAPQTADVHGVVLSSDLPEVGTLETSHALVNQLVSNVRWGQRGNFLSIPTDTPARDERLGWTGDINVFAPAAARFQDTRAFLSKWMADVRDTQKGNGNIPAVAPQPDGAFDETGVGWSDALITVPYSVWKASGDERVIRENWEAMKAFHQFVHASATGDGDLLEQGRSSWFSGDWLTLETVNRLEEHKVIGTAYFAENTRRMSEMAAAIGETVPAGQWAALVPEIRSAFTAAYRSADGSIYTGSQTAYAMALGMDMIADPAQRAVTARKFVEKLASDDFHLRTGFLGTPWLLPALTKIGRPDLAMRILLNETYPSWGFPITMGATTMWERWNSIQPDGQFGPVDMNSFNHYAYGAVADWMFDHIGGLQLLEPGYRKSRIAPGIGFGGLTSARATLRTSYGLLSCDWRIDENAATLSVTIPPGTSARVELPTGSTNLLGLVIREGGTVVWADGVPAGNSPVLSFVTNEFEAEQAVVVWDAGSGAYAFTWTMTPSPAGLTAVARDRAVSLTWQPVAGAVSYRVKRGFSPGGPYALLASDVSGTNYLDPAVTNGATYYYVVSAQAGAESNDSGVVSATPRFVPNFGFEAPQVSTYQYNPAGASWLFTTKSGDNGSGITANGSLFNSSNSDAPEGSQAAFLQGISVISQRVSGFVPGVRYVMTCSAAQRAGQFQGPGQTWDFKLDQLVLASYSPPKSATNYQDYAVEFTASAGDHELAFVGTNVRGGDNTVFLDNIRVAPKPSTDLPRILVQRLDSRIVLEWPLSHFGWFVQIQTNSLSATNWTTLFGSDLSNRFERPVCATESDVFFRLSLPRHVERLQ